MRYYLAYGSNLSVGQMLKRCPDAVYVGTGEIKDARLLFRGSGSGSYLTIEKKRTRKVPVVIWQVSDEDEKALDRYEGYPRFYQKIQMEMEVHNLLNGQPVGKVPAFVYVMDNTRPLGMPTQYYLDVCAEGYERFGFDLAILERALFESQELAERGARG